MVYGGLRRVCHSGFVRRVSLARAPGGRSEQRQLQEANDLLEAKVAKRTGELATRQQDVARGNRPARKSGPGGALAEQRNLLRTLIDSLIPDCVFIKDTQSRVLLDNLAHARGLNVASHPEDAVGKSDLDFFPAAAVTAKIHRG